MNQVAQTAPQPAVTAVVLAGGFGTRLKSVVSDVPKPMAPVLGKPFLHWQLQYLAGQGLERVILSTGHKAEVIETYFSDRQIDGIADLSCVHEAEPLGTAGGFLNCQEQAPSSGTEAWLVLNGDSMAVADLGPLLATLQDPALDGALLALWMENAARYGSLDFDEKGILRGFHEKRPGSAWINAGIYLVRDRLLSSFPSHRPLSWESDVFPKLIEEGRRFAVCQCHAPFLDIGLPESYALAETFIQENRGMMDGEAA